MQKEGYRPATVRSGNMIIQKTQTGAQMRTKRCNKRSANRSVHQTRILYSVLHLDRRRRVCGRVWGMVCGLFVSRLWSFCDRFVLSLAIALVTSQRNLPLTDWRCKMDSVAGFGEGLVLNA